MTFESEELTDRELTEMLALWTVPSPSEDLRVRVFAPQLPSLRTPYEPASWWSSLTGDRSRSFGLAFLLQASVVVLLLITVGTGDLQRTLAPRTQSIYLTPYRRNQPANSGGGGGGQHAPTPVARGEAPRMAKSFVPPAAAVVHPALPVLPAISAPAPQIAPANYGDPLSKLLGNSAGQGANGFGNGNGSGVGSGQGNGYGPGEGGGEGGGVYSPGNGVSSPVLISKIEPEYSTEARTAKYSGVVFLSIVVDEQGVPQNIRIVRPLGLGLDEKAIEAVRHWRFRPGLRNGKPVRVSAIVEVSFRLL